MPRNRSQNKLWLTGKRLECAKIQADIMSSKWTLKRWMESVTTEATILAQCQSDHKQFDQDQLIETMLLMLDLVAQPLWTSHLDNFLMKKENQQEWGTFFIRFKSQASLYQQDHCCINKLWIWFSDLNDWVHLMVMSTQKMRTGFLVCPHLTMIIFNMGSVNQTKSDQMKIILNLVKMKQIIILPTVSWVLV